MPSSSASAVIDPQRALDEPAFKDSDSSSSEDGSSDDEPAGETTHVSEAASRGNCICCLCGRLASMTWTMLLGCVSTAQRAALSLQFVFFRCLKSAWPSGTRE